MVAAASQGSTYAPLIVSPKKAMSLCCVLASSRIEIVCATATTEARDDGGRRDSVSLLSDFTEKEDSNPVLAKTSFPEVPVTHSLLTRVMYPRHPPRCSNAKRMPHVSANAVTCMPHD